MPSSIFTGFDRPAVFGHRGVPEEYQENTLAGFQRAIELGLDGIELDIMMSKDGRLVVFHDLDAERLTGCKGNICDMNWRDIKSLEIKQEVDVGDKNICYPKAGKISLLEDVLEEIRGRILVDIEIKAYRLDFRQRHTGTILASLLKRMNLFEGIFVTSFNFFPLRWLEWQCPGVESGFTYAPVVVQKHPLLHRLMESSIIGKLVGSTLTNMSMNMIDEDTIGKIQAQGMAVGAWTVFPHDFNWMGEIIPDAQQIEMVRRFAAQGIDYFISDDPARLQDILAKL